MIIGNHYPGSNQPHVDATSMILRWIQYLSAAGLVATVAFGTYMYDRRFTSAPPFLLSTCACKHDPDPSLCMQ